MFLGDRIKHQTRLPVSTLPTSSEGGTALVDLQARSPKGGAQESGRIRPHKTRTGTRTGAMRSGLDVSRRCLGPSLA